MNRHIDNMKKSFTDKYEIDVRKAKKLRDKTVKGMEIVRIW